MKRADQILAAGAKHLADRAATRDQPEGERSMARTVAAFNAMYGKELTVEQGWQFMVLLKMARSAAGAFNLDDYEDGAAYFALAAEDAYRERVEPEGVPAAPLIAKPVPAPPGTPWPLDTRFKWLTIDPDGRAAYWDGFPKFCPRSNRWWAPMKAGQPAGTFDPSRYVRGQAGFYVRVFEGVDSYPVGSLEPDPCLPKVARPLPMPPGPIKWPKGAKWLGIDADGDGMFFSERPVFKTDDGRRMNFWKAPRGDVHTWDGGYFDPEQYSRGELGLYCRPAAPGVLSYHQSLPDSGPSELPAQD